MIAVRVRDEFIYLMAKEGVKLSDCHLLLRDAGTIQRYATFFCNRELSDYEELNWKQAQARIKVTCDQYGITPVFSGDPRGACVKLKVPSGYTNDWGQIGICVPTKEC